MSWRRKKKKGGRKHEEAGMVINGFVGGGGWGKSPLKRPTLNTLSSSLLLLLLLPGNRFSLVGAKMTRRFSVSYLGHLLRLPWPPQGTGKGESGKSWQSHRFYPNDRLWIFFINSSFDGFWIFFNSLGFIIE